MILKIIHYYFFYKKNHKRGSGAENTKKTVISANLGISHGGDQENGSGYSTVDCFVELLGKTVDELWTGL